MKLDTYPNQLDYDINSATILIVDDNPSNVLLLERVLNLAGYHDIIVALDSEKVVSLYERFRPDLIMLDLLMPKMDGFEVLEALNAVKGDDYIPVIMISAQPTKENKLKALEYGVNDFIAKPYDPIEVSMHVRNMLLTRMMHNRLIQEKNDLEENIVKRTKEIYELQYDIIKRLMLAIELRDGDTGMHVIRIGLYAYEISEGLGKDESYCQRIQYAGMMHDIGKIGIADSILLKKGKLTSEEWNIMKEHTTKGADILSGSQNSMIQMSKEIALTHHEKWDGTGYPMGLKGEEIPLCGRIIAICDVFDALVSERPYKKAFPVTEAVRIILSENGRHFDPKIMKVFIEKLDKLIQIENGVKKPTWGKS